MDYKPLYMVYIEDRREKVWRPDHDDLQKEKLIGRRSYLQSLE